jgi:hypothetical protein
MADHDIGGEPLALQPFADTRDGEAVHDPHLDFLQVGRNRAGGRERQIFENADARQLAATALGQEYDIVAGGLEMPRQMQVLARKILMDEQKVHLPKEQRKAEMIVTAVRVAIGLIRRRRLLVLVLQLRRLFEDADVHRLQRVIGGSGATARLPITFRRRYPFRKE